MSYRNVSIEILKPAAITLDSCRRVALLDRNVIFHADSAFFLYNYEGITRPDLFEHFNTGIDYGFVEAELDTVIPLRESAVTRLDHSVLPEPLTAAQIGKIFTDFHTDYIIAVEGHTYRVSRKEHLVKSIRFIRLYDCRSASVIDTCFMISGFPVNKILDDETYADEIAGIAWEKGVEYTHRILPYWEETVRRVYNRGRILALGDTFFRQGNLQEAERLWSAALKTSPRIALKAATNLAWLYENNGHFEEACHILEEALEQARRKGVVNECTSYNTTYLKGLKQRLLDSRLLQQQLSFGK